MSRGHCKAACSEGTGICRKGGFTKGSHPSAGPFVLTARKLTRGAENWNALGFCPGTSSPLRRSLILLLLWGAP